MDASLDGRHEGSDAGPAAQAGWRFRRWIAGLALIAGIGGATLAACIIEGCTFPDEQGQDIEVPFVLDEANSVATSLIEISLSAAALPGDVADRGARLRLTLVDAPDVSLSFVPEGTSDPVALVASRGVVSLPLDHCRADEACTVRGHVVLEWTRPQPAASIARVLKVEGLVRVPHTRNRCGFSGKVVSVRADPPVSRSAAADSVGEPRHDWTELVRHVTLRYGAEVPSPRDGTSGADPTVIVRGHLGITPDPAPPGGRSTSTVVPGIWLRVTPDYGGPPLLDRAVPVTYPPLPADATFPVGSPCPPPCERGFWIQAAVYDPAGRTFGNPETAVFGWTFDVSVSTPEPPGVEDGAITVVLDEPTTRPPPASLVLRGSGAPFRIDSSAPVTTLIIDASVPARSKAPSGDGIGEARIVFGLTTVGAERSQSNRLWLSNGHYLGDGSTADDERDTGGSAGAAEKKSPPGRPFAACVGRTDSCEARTGFVVRRFESTFDSGAPTPPFEVHWRWTVVGAPPGATITVRAARGETLDAGGSSPPTAIIVLVVMLVGGLSTLVAAGWVARRARPLRSGGSEHPARGSGAP